MTAAKKIYLCMNKMHLSQNFVSFVVITLSNFFFFKDAMAQNLPATKTLKAKGHNRTKARRAE